jgi:hypothetical protein
MSHTKDPTYLEAWRGHAAQAYAAGADERLGTCTGAELAAKPNACLLLARALTTRSAS